MPKMPKKYISWMLSTLMCFSSSFTVIQAEEGTVPEEEPVVQEVLKEEQFEKELEITEEVEEEPADTTDDESTEEGEDNESETISDEAVENSGFDPSSQSAQTFIEDQDLTSNTGINENTDDELSADEILEEEETESVLMGTYHNLAYNTNEDGTIQIAWLYNTDDLTSVEIPSEIDGKQVTSVGDTAFYGCTNISKLIIPASITSAGDRSFAGCTGLKTLGPIGGETNIEIEFTNEITELYNQSGLFEYVEEITIPEGVEYIRSGAFSGCERLVKLNLPKSLILIEDGTLNDCTALQDIYYPGTQGQWDNIMAEPDSINATVHTYFPFEYSENTEGTITITKYNGDEEEVIIPTVIDDKYVTVIGNNSFENITSLKSIAIPEYAITIGNYAFSGCVNLISITIPDGVTSVGVSAFNNCSNLIEVHIHSVEAWCNISFSDIYSNPLTYAKNLYLEEQLLTEIHIPDGIDNIKSYAFSNCSNLTRIVIPDSVTSIGKEAFYYCSSLSSITIPGSITSVEGLLFYGCENLKTVGPIGSGSNIEVGWTTSIPDYAFYYCSYLTKVIIPDSVTNIGNSAFAFCSHLADITMPDSVTSIGDSAFYGCTSLASITIPNSVISIGNSAFEDCNSITHILIPNKVTRIGNSAFSGCDNLASITIPESVVNIEGTLFYGCKNLKTAGPIGSGSNIEVGWTTTIPAHAFENCGSLTSVSIPDSVTSIGNSAFYFCGNLADITIPDSVRSIGDGAFSECTSLSEIILPDSVISIGSGAFFDCTSLTSITMPDSVTIIDSQAFYNCTSLTSITIPDSVTSIGFETFYNCSSLKNIIIPESVTNIGDSTFYNCISLISIIIPDSVTNIGQKAFQGCENLSEVTLSKRISYISDSLFMGCINLQTINLNNIRYVGQSAFSGCTSLKTVNCQNITMISSNAFEGCSSLKEVSFINSNTIGSYAFQDCTSLENISIVYNVQTVDTGAFRNCSDNMTVHFYGTAEDWSAINIKNYNEPLQNAQIIFENAIKTLTLLPSSYTAAIRDTVQIGVVVTPEDASTDCLEWSSSDPKVATVDQNGIVTAVSDGYATITAKVPYGSVSASCTIRVYTMNASGVTLADGENILAVGESIDLDPVFDPVNTTNQNVSWSSSNEMIASVDDDGVVTGHRPGTVTITVLTEDGGFTATKDITVIQPVTGISLDEEEISLAIRDSRKLKASIAPEDATNKIVIWTSDNEEVAKVDDTGIVTVLSEGTAVITATTEDGDFTAQCTVTGYAVPVAGITVNEEDSSSEIEFGRTGNIQISFEPENATNQDLTWSSSDESIAVVDENGVVTAVGEGPVTITATSDDGGFKASKEIIIFYKHLTSLSFSEDSAEVLKTNTVELTPVYEPADASNKKVTWKSSDENVAVVDENGKVTAIEGGTAVISVTSEDGNLTAEITVHVIVKAEKIEIISDVTELTYGESVMLEKSFTPANTTNQNVTWSSSDPTIATVDENGKVTAVGEGKVTITATSKDGGFTANKEINILFTHVDSVKFTETEISALVDEKVQLEAVIAPEDASVKDMTYTTSNDNVAAVDENGKVTIISGGSAIITATTADGGKTATCKITAYPLGISIEELPDYTYTGQAFKPAVKVYDKGQQLQEKTDYTVTYKNNVKAGEASVIIKSNKKGNYKGTQTVHFMIEPADISEENPDITVDILTAQATGKTLSPVPTVYFNGKKLKNKTDYIVSYDNYGNRTTPGQHIVTITGKGNFTGTRAIPVEVAPVGMVSMSKLKVTSKAIPFTDLTGDFMADFAGRITLKNGKTTLLQGVEYEVIEDSAVNCDSIGTCTFAVEGKGTYVGSRTVSVKITGVSLSDKKVKVVSPAYVYTGEEIELGEGFAVTYNGALLVKDADYEIVSYSNNVNAGTATAVLKGINKYTGTRNVNFKIAPDASVVDAGRVSVPDTVYSKGGAKPPVTVEGMTLGTDYTVKYSDNTKAGVGTVTVTFKGNYKNAPDVIKTFAIEKKDLSKVNISAKDMEYSTKANKYKSKPVLTDTDGKVLKAGTDYETVYRYTTEDGKELPPVVPAETVVKVTVVGKGNYIGEISTTYRILNVKTDISKASFKIQPQEFTGSLIELDPENDILSAKINKTTDLVYGTDYVIDSYTNNLKKGTAKVTFRGINGYGGTKTVSFKIGQRSIVDYWQGAIKYINSLFGRN